MYEMNKHLTVDFPAESRVVYRMQNKFLSFDCYSHILVPKLTVYGDVAYVYFPENSLPTYKTTHFMPTSCKHLLLLEQQVGKALGLSDQAKLLQISVRTGSERNFMFSSQRIS